MCRIGGVIDLRFSDGKNNRIGRYRAIVKKMAGLMIYGGEYVRDFNSDKANIFQVHLPINDEKQQTDPLVFEGKDGCRYAIAFNGEIYNWKKLKSGLQAKGHKFKTNKGDTEVIVKLYDEYGPAFLNLLNGMFAFLIYDLSNGDIFAARDHAGIKPFYFCKSGQRFFFASEIKALSFVDEVDEVKMLNQGEYMYNSGVVKWYDPDKIPIIPLTFEDCRDQLKKRLIEAVKMQVDTDEPIAVFLSGGIDSTIVLEIASRYHDNIIALITGLNNSSDKKFAVKYCRDRGINYRIVPITDNEMLGRFKHKVYLSETFEKNMCRNIFVTELLSREAHRLGIKVALCGEGADELLAGYSNFKTAGSETETMEMIRQFRQDLDRTQLQRCDRASMRHTVELRVPFLDRKVFDLALNMPLDYLMKKTENGIIEKHILREAFKGEIPDYIRLRVKVPYNEGVGYGNNQEDNMIYRHLQTIYGDFHHSSDRLLFRRQIREFNISSKEELYYFRHFVRLGFCKAKFIANRARTI